MSQPKTEWIDCPICGESDMRMDTDFEGNKLVYCTNHNCASNGGDNISGMRISIKPGLCDLS